MTKKAQAQIIAALKKFDSAKKARAWLLLEHGIEGKEASQLIKEAGIGGNRAGGLMEDFQKFVIETLQTKGEVTKDDVVAWASDKSQNAQKSISYYYNIAKLATEVWKLKK